jgi:hypothetical protein
MDPRSIPFTVPLLGKQDGRPEGKPTAEAIACAKALKAYEILFLNLYQGLVMYRTAHGYGIDNQPASPETVGEEAEAYANEGVKRLRLTADQGAG